MTRVSAEEVQSFVLARFSEPLRAKRLAPADVPDDFDLLTEGVIDSLGILELYSEIEVRFGFDVDFEDLDASDLTRVGSLSRYVAAKSGKSAAA